MENIQKFLNSVKKKKFWDIKDTYLYKAKLGNHWHIKKYIVLFKYFLADRNEINKIALDLIFKNFEKFCNSINASSFITLFNITGLYSSNIYSSFNKLLFNMPLFLLLISFNFIIVFFFCHRDDFFF